MDEKSFHIVDKSGRNLNARKWEAGEDQKAIVAIIHGLGDHIDRYDHFSKFLNTKGISTIGMDYQGHGKSPGKRGHIPSYDLLLSNVENLLITARRAYNELPLFLYGQSLGGNIVANYILRHQSKELSGAIISSPFLELAFTPPKWKANLAKILNGLLPSFALSNEIEPMELSHDPVVGKAYFEDPLVHDKISVRLYNLGIEYGRWALENASLLSIPLLLMHGDEDQLTSFHASERFAGDAGAKAKLKIWKGMRHEVHNETRKEEVLEYICRWIHENLHEQRAQDV